MNIGGYFKNGFLRQNMFIFKKLYYIHLFY